VGEMIRSRAWVKGIDVAVVLDTCIERYIRTDLGKLRQVIINLLGNAVKFTERGNVTLRVRTAPVAGNLQRRFLEVEVEDTGPGIPKEKIDAIFDPFTQVGSIKASQKGTGLGLTISRSFISLLGGEITVKSEEGKGSIFRVRVQVDAVPAEEVPAAEVPPREVVGLEPGEPEWRVLVVEDDPENVVLLEVLLTQVGFSVRTASSDWEGIGVAEAWHPHFIWIAMRMPVIDGYETARRIRAYPWGKDIGIFVLTAHVYMEQEENLLAAGCDGVLFKPYRYGEIFEVMARHLGVRYRYSDKVAGGSPVLSDSGPPSEPAVEELAALQPEVAHRIRHAAVTLNKRDILAIADEIYEEHPAVSAFLKGQTASYRFEAIELLMELLDANQLP